MRRNDGRMPGPVPTRRAALTGLRLRRGRRCLPDRPSSARRAVGRQWRAPERRRAAASVPRSLSCVRKRREGWKLVAAAPARGWPSVSAAPAAGRGAGWRQRCLSPCSRPHELHRNGCPARPLGPVAAPPRTPAGSVPGPSDASHAALHAGLRRQPPAPAGDWFTRRSCDTPSGWPPVAVGGKGSGKGCLLFRGRPQRSALR